MISKFQREVTAWVRQNYPGCDVDGYDTSEANLGKLAGMTGCNLRADVLLWIDDSHALVIECHSELHDDRGKAAFGGTMDDHYGRIGRDELKRQLINRLGFGLVEIWPGEDFQKKIAEAVDECPETEISCHQTQSRRAIIKDTRKQQWSKQELKSTSELPQGQKMPKSSGFEKGRKL